MADSVTISLGIDATGARQGANEFASAVERVSSAGKRASDSADALKRSMSEEQRVYEQTRSRAEAYAGELQHVSTMHRTGAASAEAYSRSISRTRTGIDEAAGAAARFGGALDRAVPAMTGFTGGVGRLSAAFPLLSSAMMSAGATIAAGFSFAAIIGQASAVTRHFGEIADAATRVGSSATEMQVLRQVFIENASSTAELSTALEFLQAKVGDALGGTDAAVSAFERLGITTDQLSATNGNAAQQLELVARAIVGIHDPSERAAALQDVLGRSGKSTQQALAGLADTLENRVNSAIQSGNILSEEMVQKFAALDDRMALLNERSNTLASEGLYAIQNAWVGIQEATLSAIGFMEKYMVSQQLSRSLQALQEAPKPAYTTGGGFGGEPFAHEKESDLSLSATKMAGMPKPVPRYSGMVELEEAPRARGSGRGGGTRRRAAGGARAAGVGTRLSDFEFGKPFDSEMNELESRSQEALTQTQRATQDMLQRVQEAHLRAFGEETRLIELRRDKEIHELQVSAASQEERARARVQIEETASREIIEIRRREAQETQRYEEEYLQTQAQNAFGQQRRDLQRRLVEMRRDAELETISASTASQQQKDIRSAFVTGTAREQLRVIDPTPWEAAARTLQEFGEGLTGVEGMTQGVIQGLSSIGATATSAFADAIVSGESFADVLESLAQSLQKMIIQMTMQMALQQALGAGASALGGWMAGPGAGAGAGGPVTYNQDFGIYRMAKGGKLDAMLAPGIYNRPTYFETDTSGVTRMARGFGLLGEAGPEAVMPLRRTGDGRLGVQASDDTGALRIMPVARLRNGNFGILDDEDASAARFAKGGVVGLEPGVYDRPAYFRTATPGIRAFASGGIVEPLSPARERYGSDSGGSTVNVIVNNNSSAKVDQETRDRPDGNRDIILTLADQVENIVANRLMRSGTRVNRAVGTVGAVTAR